MKASKKSSRPAAFMPADEQSLTNEWLLTEEVTKILRCSIGTIKNLRKKKLLPYSKIGGLIYYNSRDVHQMLLLARRRSFLLIIYLQWFADVLGVATFDIVV